MIHDFAQELLTRTGAEPYRTKVVEHLNLPDRAAREQILAAAHYSPAYLNSADVFIDLVTDSGTSAMSDEQWGALMRGDEAYIRSKSFFAFERAVQHVLGFKHVVPTHQGRAAENLIMEVMVQPGQMVLSNTHFDTTKAHVEHRKGQAIDLVGDWMWDFATPQPFKGNFDLEKLTVALDRYHEQVPLIIITITNNLACSSPVSMENIREVRRLADRHGIPVYFDACRFAENAFFIKAREAGYADKSVAEIVLEMMSYGHGCWVSAKKDAIVNIGGFIATNDENLAGKCQGKLVLYEGFPTYGGLARRDLEAIAVGLQEGIQENYLSHRTGLVEHLGNAMEQAGVIVSQPIGGSGVFVDVNALYPHLSTDKFPGIALFCDLYLEGGVRAGATPLNISTVSPKSGDIVERVFQFARFAVPRRVYSRSHMDFVAGIMGRVVANAGQNRGYRMTNHPEILAHFFAKFAPLS
ncbi:MAG: tryptophanase [Polyangiaceae bacterium]